MNEVLNTIMEQINWRVLRLANCLFIKIDENTLRINKGQKNIDIKYNEGLDLYTVTKHTMRKKGFEFKVDSEKHEQIYCDQLQDLIGEHFGFPLARCNL